MSLLLFMNGVNIDGKKTTCRGRNGNNFGVEWCGTGRLIAQEEDDTNNRRKKEGISLSIKRWKIYYQLTRARYNIYTNTWDYRI